ncbi:hypothetical protein ASPCADRAFT_202121, partial [Aspergillus carbonarius ITEM 5010]
MMTWGAIGGHPGERGIEKNATPMQSGNYRAGRGWEWELSVPLLGNPDQRTRRLLTSLR